MRLVYFSDINDHVAFNLWLIPLQKGYRKRFWIARIVISFCCMMPFFLVAAFFKDSNPSLIANVMIGGLFAGIGMFATYPKNVRKNQEKCIRNLYSGDKGEGTLFGKHIVEIIDDTLVERTELSETRKKIAALGKIEEIPGYVFIMLEEPGAFVIPKGKVEEGNLDEFIGELKKVGLQA